MSDWVTIRVPEANRDDAKDIRPKSATHGDCLVAGAKALAAADRMQFDEVDALIDAAGTDTTGDGTDSVSEQLDRIEAAAKEATEAAQSAEASVEDLQP